MQRCEQTWCLCEGYLVASHDTLNHWNGKEEDQRRWLRRVIGRIDLKTMDGMDGMRLTGSR